MTFKRPASHSAEMGDLKKISLQEIHVLERGQGRPIILLHGYSFSLETFRKTFEPLAVNNHLYAIDLPGCGWSPKPTGKCDVDTFVHLIVGFMDNERIGSACIIGSYEGAIIAMRIAELYPDKVNTLILLSPGSLTLGYPFYYRLMHVRHLGDIILRFAKKHSFVKWLKWNVFNETCVDEEMINTYMEFAQRPVVKVAFLKMIRAYSEHDTVEYMHGIKCPSLFIWGEQDKGHPCSHSDFFIEKIENSRIRFLRNCGGLLQEEKPVELCKIIDNFQDLSANIIY